MPDAKYKLYHALSGEARTETLKLLYKKPHDIEELAKKLGLRPVTVRHHIQALSEAGLLETYEERTGSAGRPKTFYKIATSLPVVTFPARQYLYFSKILIHYLLRKFREKKTCEMIAEVGREFGRETVKYLEAANNVTEWTPKEFVDVFVEKFLQEMGAEPEVLEKTDDRVVFRTHNCLFFELSQELPSLMCDIHHHEFYQALLEAMRDNINWTQTCCMGHADQFCEQVCEWTSKKSQENVS